MIYNKQMRITELPVLVVIFSILGLIALIPILQSAAAGSATEMGKAVLGSPVLAEIIKGILGGRNQGGSNPPEQVPPSQGPSPYEGVPPSQGPSFYEQVQLIRQQFDLFEQQLAFLPPQQQEYVISNVRQGLDQLIQVYYPQDPASAREALRQLMSPELGDKLLSTS